ncbi:TetR/AcrR family transcriptional regulator [Microbacterium sp. Leaf436]|uniref:TetR/AcrR family transcriptional regulator n=1 Tax=Microbacterium sp. Leaf436 TaxID=1736377 RepID=UPI000701844F|nr:TetR/AcrR family transcriptional regulator [Microbacterium sp. Leaf436]KQT74533.1 hypothetical protein ASG45_08170 [Microbacterium sp. Leaf436]
MTISTESGEPHEQKTPRALRRDAAENRRRLLDAAREVFAEHGLEAGVEEVAQVAGVGVGTLYRRFLTKDALIAELVREFMEQVLALVREATTVSDGRGLEQFVFALGDVQSANRGCLARIWTDEHSTALRQQYRIHLAEVLEDAKAHGVVRTDAAMTDLDLLFWALRGIIETTGALAPGAWRRHAAIHLAGLRPSASELSHPPVGEDVVARSRDSLLQQSGAPVNRTERER